MLLNSSVCSAVSPHPKYIQFCDRVRQQMATNPQIGKLNIHIVNENTKEKPN